MDQKRLPIFIAITLAILLVSQWLAPPRRHSAPAPTAVTHQAEPAAGPQISAPHGLAAAAAANAPHVAIDAPSVIGGISLLGARLDQLHLKDYHETVSKTSPLVQVLVPPSAATPSYIEFGWSATDGVKVPDDSTLWTSSGGTVTPDHPVTLSWDNKAGLIFQIMVAVDDHYLFSIRQSVHNASGAEVQLWPWQRARRDYQPPAPSYGVLFEGLLGVMDRTLHSMTFASAKNTALKDNDVAYDHEGAGGWAGFTDKYWLTALIPDQSASVKTSWNYTFEDGEPHYQVSFLTTDPEKIAPGATASYASRAYVGAKEVHLLNSYETRQGIPLLSYAVDWGHLFFLTKPFFYALDFLYSLTGNFGVAILIFTLGVKALFYPIAARSYRQMGKMRLLAPKIQQVRERYKDDQAKLQSEMMAVYKAENVSPVSGCLPMLIQIPVFFALYKVILVTIEMRHAPFFGWIQDLSATDPTNIFNLFGLLPFDPGTISPMLHLGIWPLVLGGTMYIQQRLNPPPPDPTQARMLQFMPLIFMFSMGRFPAGLVIYWSWNNTLTFVQQWAIQRQAKLSPKPARLAKT